jgi:membrane dipeptidase
MLDVFYSECARNAETIVPVHDYQGIRDAYRDGRIAAMLSIEGGEPLEGDLGVLRMLYRLGIRMIGLTWYYRNALADGLWEHRTKGGLTRFGVNVVEEMTCLGMIADVSHLTDEGFWDLLDVTANPVIASHSNARTVCASPRNLTDDQIKALAERGGVVGLNFSSRHVKEERATVKDLVDHVDHIVRLVGADYVGLGSDFDGTRTPPEGLEDASRHPNFTRELVERGYSDHEIQKMLGENHLRVFKKVLR